MGAASYPHIADEGWAGFGETEEWESGERERRREGESKS